MSERRLWVLGATKGNIGAETYQRLRNRTEFGYAWSDDIETLDVRYNVELRRRIRETRPTDVVYSVGINKLDWVKSISPSEFTQIMNINVLSFLNLIKFLDDEKCGPVNIVAVTSDAARRPMRTSAVYCASKAALEMCVRVASREYAPGGWRINAVAPGKVEDTPMTEYVDRRVLELRGWTEEYAENYERQSNPLGRKVYKNEVAQVIEQVLMGPKSQTGEIIAVNGGR
jgi:NAD(P)-dependent dehydrogenase (short-subunit alcohol dehydrogenase family)